MALCTMNYSMKRAETSTQCRRRTIRTLGLSDGTPRKRNEVTRGKTVEHDCVFIEDLMHRLQVA